MNELRFYDIAAVATITDLDLGQAAPASSDDSMLRLINTSNTYLAKDVTVNITGGDAVQLWLSADGDTFSTAIDLGDIQPSGSSPTFWLRRVTPSTTSDGPAQAELTATPTAWINAADTSSSDNVPLETE